MKIRLLIVSVLLSAWVFGQEKHYVLVLSKAGRNMLVLDYKTLDSLTSIPVGEDPHEIALNDDGSLAYISNPVLNGSGHEINIVNLKTLKPEKNIDTRPFYIPHGLVYRHGNLWFTAQGSKVVGVYNTQTEQVEQVFGTGQDFTHMLYVTPDEKRFYTTNVESGTVSIYEKKELPPYMSPTGVLPPNAKLRLEWRQTLVHAGLGVEGFDVSEDGELWTARPDGYLIVVDLEQKTIKDSINTQVQGLHRIQITPDGKSVAVVSVKTGDLLFYNRKTHALEKQLNIGRGAGIYMDRESNRMFVSCTPENEVVVIDLQTKKELKRFPVGRPDGIISVTVK